MNTTVGIDHKAAFERAFSAWEPNEDEATCPDNAWFYRAFDCLRDAFGKETMERYNGLWHNAICWTRGESYEAIVKNFKDAALKNEAKPRPIEAYWSYESEPVFDVLNEAYEIFKQQFKAKWKDKRINSKFANEKWDSVREKAVELARSAFDERHKRWQEKRDRRAQEYQARLAEWQEKENERLALIEFANTL